MTEYVGEPNDELTSMVISSTCELLPKSFSDVSEHMHNLMLTSELTPKNYLILSGSMAEFYIRPLNTCITDTDYLISKTGELACSGEYPVLPSDMSGLPDAIACGRIESYKRYPGFVRLRDIGSMNYDWKCKKYKFKHRIPQNIFVTIDMAAVANEFRLGADSTSIVNGPAVTYKSHHGGSDVVRSVWCPQWPREAQGWPIRPRYYGWPTIETISQVVQQGCHVVYVQHRDCRDDDLQWRLSFSIAEVILLQSWTQIQQIVYHLLRFLAKRELIQKDCPKEDEVLCMYHLKTLMLWTCEEMPLEWWNSSSVIAICSELLQKLSEWLKKGHCPNYFIPEGNLFYEQWSSTMFDKTVRRLNEFSNSGILCEWFVENYILPVARKLFEVQCTSNTTQHFLILLCEFRKANESRSLDLKFSERFISSQSIFRSIVTRKYESTAGLRGSLKSQNDASAYLNNCHEMCIHVYLPKITKVLCFSYYTNLLYILHTAYGLVCGKISWESSLFVEFVKGISTHTKMLRSKFHNFPKKYAEACSRFQFLRAQDLMENLIGSNSRSEFQLLSLMSKEFLRKNLYESGCPTCKCIGTAALAYLAALHFATAEYQQARRFCLAVLDQIYVKDTETLNAGCLLFIDDVARIVGLCVLHKKITENNLHYIGKRLYLDLRLSPEVFAYYLTVLSAERISKHFAFSHDLPNSEFQIDEYLKFFIKRKCIVSTKSSNHNHFHSVSQIVYRRTDSLAETESRRLNPLIVKKFVIDVLMEYALENMTSFYSVLQKDFGIQCSTVDCFRALYLYKCRKYDEVLNLCERILQQPNLQSDLKEFAFANVLVLPPLDSFYDRDVQSLLGFHTLFYYLSPLTNHLLKFDLTDESTFAHWFAARVCFQEKELSESLRETYSIKCNYFLGRQFLARYLKVRCCIDRNLLYSDALTEFAAQKTNLPFERIIHRFLLQKLLHH